MPYINLISPANPEIKIPQNEIAGFMQKAMRLNEDESRKLNAIFRMSGIKQRHTVIADYQYSDDSKWNFYPKAQSNKSQPNTAERMQLFERHALPLAQKSLEKVFGQYRPNEFTHLITVSCTGMFAPGLDIQLIKNAGLNSDIERTSIQFMGCFAAFNALKTANHICRSDKQAKVLIVCVELCTIHFQADYNEDNLLANTLFADGASSVVVTNDKTDSALEIKAFKSVVENNSEQEMAWNIGNLGFEMKLSSYVPEVIAKNIAKLGDELMQKLNLKLQDIDQFAIHPGGKRILEAVEKGLNVSSEKNKSAYKVLSEFGNMSSPTVLFVLHEMWDNIKPKDKILSFAFGPGLTMESMLLEQVEI
ncbi:type III polyketide synthase [Marivirga arenosa]|uniref:Type III polyketide synthase n=1 Tax=Marivirga arenosa TaxID=3059076 RepID=A0AA51R7M2_9BACT|nr:type III polyketide synthase [Marivirga sp. ABR2-2]WMN07777.1 type III polyketide synthase [Marivirga sp. ABR2-2]